MLKLPADVGDENGETVIDERKIRIKPLPKKQVRRPPEPPADVPVSDIGTIRSGRKLLKPKMAGILLNFLDLASLVDLHCLLPKNILYTQDIFLKQIP